MNGYETAAVTLHTRMGNAPYEEVNLGTGTPALGERVTSIARRMRQPNADLPEPAELVAQLATLYGEPTWLNIDRYNGTSLQYVWTASGQMPPQNERPCEFRGFESYSYRTDRSLVDTTECLAILSMSYESRAGQSIVRFNLTDYQLLRMNIAETDRQISDYLESNT
ncbi:MAG: hypothetical protein Q4G26_10455, partial [Paracoccus sp. (in: a-proteobacteria)]|nr:hypothetical protein [Paracoccus sp. (in: a-proteobacteria)]